MIKTIIIVVLVLIVLVLIYTQRNLLRKVELLEDLAETHSSYLIKLNDAVMATSNRLQELDDKEMFSSDDEIGFFFNYVKKMQSLLKSYITDNIKELNQ